MTIHRLNHTDVMLLINTISLKNRCVDHLIKHCQYLTNNRNNYYSKKDIWILLKRNRVINLIENIEKTFQSAISSQVYQINYDIYLREKLDGEKFMIDLLSFNEFLKRIICELGIYQSE